MNSRFLKRLLFIPLLVQLLVLLIWWAVFPTELFPPRYSRVLLDRGGELLSARIASDGQWRFPPLGGLPDKYRQALIRFEDRRYYFHAGVDMPALFRAFRDNLTAGEVVSGGSTITMQVMRMSLGNPGRTLLQKGYEALLALQANLRFSKEEILSIYASNAPFGGNVVGIEAASWRYFHRDPYNISWAEAALLAVLPNSPSAINLETGRALLKAKRDRLLAGLAETGVISEEDLRFARSEPVPSAPFPLNDLAPHVMDLFSAENKEFRESGGKITTTIDRNLQIHAANVVNRNGRFLNSYDVQNAAALMADTFSGEIRAYIGNLGYPGVQDRHVDIVSAPRSTGSLLKPFLYAVMMDDGMLLPRQLVPDVPIKIGTYVPENHTHEFRGAVPADQALIHSLNVPMALLLRDFGVDRFYGVLKELGMSTLYRSAGGYGITLILGGAEGTLRDLVGMYAGLTSALIPSGGSQHPPYRTLRLREGNPDYVTDRPAITPAAWWLTLQAMQQLDRPGEDGSWESYSSSRRIAWKTGTSYGNRDAWSIGVTADMTIGVWAGNARGNGNPALKGSEAAAPILFDLFNLVEQKNKLHKPAGFIEVETCTESGYLAGPDCSHREYTQVPSKPNRVCPYCRIVHTDPDGLYQVDSSVMSPDRIVSTPRFVLPPQMEWYYLKRTADYSRLPPLHPAIAKNAAADRLILVNPAQGDTIYLPVDFGSGREKLVCEAFHSDPQELLFWHLDDEFLGSTSGFHTMEIHPGPGEHTVTVMDGEGNHQSHTITIVQE